MSARPFIAAILIAGAGFAAVWGLLHDSPQEVRADAPAANVVDTLDARVEPLPAESVPERSRGAGDGVAAARSAAVPSAATSPFAALDTGDAAEPIPLLEGITLPGGMWTLHTAMEREPRDVRWATDMERHFSMYFASKPELGRNYGQPSVVCRTRFCEIQAVGYGPRAFDTWKTATEDLRDQAWGADLRAGGIYTIERAPNEQAVVLILMRPWIVARDGGFEMRLTQPAQ